jgi:hypothetical protein
MTKKFKIFSGLEKYYLSENLSDITFLIDGNKVFTHKFILCFESPFFKSMLWGDFKESNAKEIELKETPVEAFKVLLKYFYFEGFNLREDISNDHSLAIEIFKLSHRFQMKELSDVIEEELIEMISYENIAIFCELGLFYELNKLLDALKQFVAQNGVQIVNDKHFLSESFETMAKILEFVVSQNFPQNIIISALTEIIAKNPDQEIKLLRKSINFDLCTLDDMKALSEIHLFSDKELYDKLDEKCRKYCQKVKNAFESHNSNQYYLSYGRNRNQNCTLIHFDFNF